MAKRNLYDDLFDEELIEEEEDETENEEESSDDIDDEFEEDELGEENDTVSSDSFVKAEKILDSQIPKKTKDKGGIKNNVHNQ